MNVLQMTTKAVEETGNPWPVVGVLGVFLGILAVGLVFHLKGDNHHDDH